MGSRYYETDTCELLIPKVTSGTRQKMQLFNQGLLVSVVINTTPSLKSQLREKKVVAVGLERWLSS